MNNLLEHFVTLWVVIDPIGTIPVFIAVTAGLTAASRRKTALLASLISAGVLLFFLVFGQLLIEALDIGLNSFQVAGGIILFLFALTMIFGESKQEIEQRRKLKKIRKTCITSKTRQSFPSRYPHWRHLGRCWPS